MQLLFHQGSHLYFILAVFSRAILWYKFKSQKGFYKILKSCKCNICTKENYYQDVVEFNWNIFNI